ncbi:hypothetical protein B0I35DRAFT_474813 [Stachybotrys elegans]|uniref:Developmental regulatory protein wetA n=1 Tax=Stachybotrys elegans TaxID=80388 RepID=A0A8K0SVT6_9HYPO|nr:hypothetical protein B0I35DRAFT_474813 [Stachybotrys elegans]
MAYWALPPYRGDTAAVDRDPSFYCYDLEDEDENDAPEPPPSAVDFFGQFVDFGSATAAAAVGGPGSGGGDGGDGGIMGDMHIDAHAAALSDALLMHHHAAAAATDSTGSSGVSTADEFDFLSSSSQAGPSVNHDIDPSSLLMGPGDVHHAAAMAAGADIYDCGPPPQYHRQQLGYALRETSVSDGDVARLEAISLKSPVASTTPIPEDNAPASPPAPITAQRKPNRFVQALSSTIRKPFARRRGRKDEGDNIASNVHRAVSPTLDNPPMALKPQSRLRAVTGRMPASPPNSAFIHGICEDPFVEPPAAHQPGVRYFTHHGLNTPDDSPAIPIPGKIDESRESTVVPQSSTSARSVPTTPWPLSDTPQQPVPHPAPDQWVTPGHEYSNPGQAFGWWDLNIINQQGEFGEPKDHPHNYGATPNFTMPLQPHQMDMAYEYADPIADPGAAGLMIHQPQPQAPQSTVVNNLALHPPTYLPPPSLPPPATERSHRPPRAPSAGARRNLSCSPMRKTRGPSASPTPGHAASSRQGSGTSVSSTRSASGRLPGTMPGTPCSVRKQRPRKPSGGGGSSEIGFVNFTPNDGNLLMTGVAPSGSSKTKARREKEAQERRRRLSEAAIKAVAAAGGDVDKLVEQGFAF